MADSVTLISKFCTSIADNPSRPLSASLRAELASVAAALSATRDVESAIVAYRTLLSAHGCGAWVNRLARPRKSNKARKVDVAVAELHKVLFVVQLLSLVDAPLSVVDAAAAAAADEVDDVADERLMLWVDDHPENNSAEIAKYGPKYDVAFHQLVSTATTRAYLARHPALKRRPASRFRLISDRHRDDEPGGQAGQNLVRALRRDAWYVPALLYCGDPATVWGVADVIALQTELTDLLVCCTQLQLDLYLQTMLVAQSAGAAVAPVDDGYASAADDNDSPSTTTATTASTTTASGSAAAAAVASAAAATATVASDADADLLDDDGSTTEEDLELHAAAEREAIERRAAEEAAAATAAAAAKAEAEAKAVKARAAAEAKARAAAEAKAKAEADARAAAEAKARAEAEARARVEAAERERRLRQLARVEGEIPSDCRCGETISFELRAFDGRDDMCDERLFVEAVSDVAGAEALMFAVTRNALGVWRCHAKLTTPGRYGVTVTSANADSAWLHSELRCAPGRATTVRARAADDGSVPLGELSALWLAPLDACGNVTALETNRRLDVRLVGTGDALLENDVPHTLDALVERAASGGEYRAVFFPTRVGVYAVRVLTRGADITSEPRISVNVAASIDDDNAAGAGSVSMKRKERVDAGVDDNADKRARTIAMPPPEESSTTTVDMEARPGNDADDDADLNDIDAILEQVHKPSDSSAACTQVMEEEDDDDDDAAGEPTLAFGALALPRSTASNKHADSSAGDDEDDDRMAEPTLAFMPPVRSPVKHTEDDDDDEDPTVPTLALELDGDGGAGGGATHTIGDRDLLGGDDDDDDDDDDGNEPTLMFDKHVGKTPPVAFEFKSPLPPPKKQSSPQQTQQTQQQQQQQKKQNIDVFADIPASEVAAMASEMSDEEPTVDKTAFELPTLEI